MTADDVGRLIDELNAATAAREIAERTFTDAAEAQQAAWNATVVPQMRARRALDAADDAEKRAARALSASLSDQIPEPRQWRTR